MIYTRSYSRSYSLPSASQKCVDLEEIYNSPNYTDVCDEHVSKIDFKRLQKMIWQISKIDYIAGLHTGHCPSYLSDTVQLVADHAI